MPPSGKKKKKLSTSSRAKKPLKYKLSPNQEINSNYKFFWYLFETN